MITHDLAPLERETMHRDSALKQQDLEKLISLDRHILCAPTAFYNLALTSGYQIEPEEFALNLDWSTNWNEAVLGWSRGGLSKMVRKEYGIQNISWWSSNTGQRLYNEDIDKMCQAGYLSPDPDELMFFRSQVENQATGFDGILNIVKSGSPIIITVKPDFAANQASHAIILEKYNALTDTVLIFDPDARNQKTVYTSSEITASLAADGACTAFLPNK